MRNSIVILFALFVFVSGWGQETYGYVIPEQLSDGWEVNDLHAMEVNTAGIYKLFNYYETTPNKLHSVLLVANGQLILEEYLNEGARATSHDLRSVGKSIRSLLLGIAIEKGFIDSVDDPISKYLKKPIPTKNLDERKSRITIKDLITMSSGLECNDWNPKSKGQEDRVYKKKNWLQYTLDLPMIHEPGTVSAYCSMGVILMVEVISQASGMSIDTFAEKYLFQQLDIESVQWGHTSKKEVIASGKRIYMTSRDLAKIGLLVLNNGFWEGEQVVSANWIEESTTPKTKITGMDYGYLWWNIPFVFKGETVMTKVATGNGGQYIMVVPDLDMVAIFTGGAYNSQEDKVPFAMMRDVFIPTFYSQN